MINNQEKDISFKEKTKLLNKVTIAAIREGKTIAYDESVASYNNIEDLKTELNT